MELGQKKAEAIALTNRINPAVFSKEIAFKHIKPYEFVNSLKEVILDPTKIKQSGHPICGVSVALKIAAELDPVTLVKMAVNLYVNGYYNPGSFLLRQINVPQKISNNESKFGLSAASYVLQVSLKNFLNRFSSYNPSTKNKLRPVQGVTFPWQIRKFLTDYFKVDAISKSLFKNDFEFLKNKIEAGHRIIALSSWKQLKNPSAKLNPLDLHYLLIKGIEKKDGKIILYTDNSSSNSNKMQEFKFSNDKELRKGIRAIYCYNKRGFKEHKLLEQEI